jgi:PIN domain nuclease of toxin-antitoxin system
MAERFVLDAYAVLALLDDEPGADEVAAILSAQDREILISAINVGEVDSILRRRAGAERARAAEDAVYGHPRLRVAEATRERIRAAAEAKARGGLSLADAFAAGLARELDAPLVTGDPEFKRLAGDGLRLRWLGPST